MSGRKYKAKMRKGAPVPPGPGTYRVFEYALLQAGIKEATNAMTMVAGWLIVREALGRWPHSIDEYCDWWNQATATGYRELRSFRRCFPMHEFPTDLCVACNLRIPFGRRRDEDPASVVAWLSQRKMTVAA